MININKKDFVEYIDKIQEYIEDSNKLNEVISSVGDGYFVFSSADTLMYIIIELLGKLTNSTTTDEYGNDIDYYFFEDSKSVWVNDKEYIIDTPEKLYNFLVLMDNRDEN